MARTIASIQAQIIASKNDDGNLAGLTTPSQTGIWLAWTYIQAVARNLFEQLLDVFKSDFEAGLIKSTIGVEAWIKDQVLKFQYSSTNVQVVTLVNFVPTYAVVDETLRIITRCAIVNIGNRIIQIKVATDSGKLDTNQLASLQSYLNTIMPAGVYCQAFSSDADLIRIEGSVYYNGIYSPVIQTNVIESINNYFYNLPFNGSVVLSELETAIKATTGVLDIKLTRLTVRISTESFNVDTNYQLYRLQGTLTDSNNRFYQTYAGYVIGETTTSNTLIDTLTFIAQ